MTNQLVARVLLYVVALFIGAVIIFALAVSWTPNLTGEAAILAAAAATTADGEAPEVAPARGIPAVPHPVDIPRFENCENCHALDARRAMPRNHATFGNQTCMLCHAYPQPEAPAAAAAAQAAPQTFGWVAPFTDEARSAFALPDACVVGRNLEQIVMGTDCSVRQDGAPCVACHNGRRADGGVRLDDLTGKQDLIDRGYVSRFVAETSAKPDNVKRMFADWQARGYPD